MNDTLHVSTNVHLSVSWPTLEDSFFGSLLIKYTNQTFTNKVTNQFEVVTHKTISKRYAFFFIPLQSFFTPTQLPFYGILWHPGTQAVD